MPVNEEGNSLEACKPIRPNDAISVRDPVQLNDPPACTACAGADDEPQCKLASAGDCSVQHAACVGSPEQLHAKYKSLH